MRFQLVLVRLLGRHQVSNVCDTDWNLARRYFLTSCQAHTRGIGHLSASESGDKINSDDDHEINTEGVSTARLCASRGALFLLYYSIVLFFFVIRQFSILTSWLGTVPSKCLPRAVEMQLHCLHIILGKQMTPYVDFGPVACTLFVLVKKNKNIWNIWAWYRSIRVDNTVKVP